MGLRERARNLVARVATRRTLALALCAYAAYLILGGVGDIYAPARNILAGLGVFAWAALAIDVENK